MDEFKDDRRNYDATVDEKYRRRHWWKKFLTVLLASLIGGALGACFVLHKFFCNRCHCGCMKHHCPCMHHMMHAGEFGRYARQLDNGTVYVIMNGDRQGANPFDASVLKDKLKVVR